MSCIIVTPLTRLNDVIAEHHPSHLVTLLSDKHMIETPEGIPPANHLKLEFSDIAEPQNGLTAPNKSHVEQLIAFGHSWSGSAPLVSQCWAGVSRSMAAAYILMCDMAGPGSEYAIARSMRNQAPQANPNRLLVGLADHILGREGRMSDAVEDMGRAKFMEEGVPVVFSWTKMPQ